MGAVLRTIVAPMFRLDGEWRPAVVPGAEAELHFPQKVDKDGIPDRCLTTACTQKVVRILLPGNQRERFLRAEPFASRLPECVCGLFLKRPYLAGCEVTQVLTLP